MKKMLLSLLVLILTTIAAQAHYYGGSDEPTPHHGRYVVEFRPDGEPVYYRYPTRKERKQAEFERQLKAFREIQLEDALIESLRHREHTVYDRAGNILFTYD